MVKHHAHQVKVQVQRIKRHAHWYNVQVAFQKVHITFRNVHEQFEELIEYCGFLIDGWPFLIAAC